MATRPELPVIRFASRDAWAAWLAERHADSPGAWLEIAKKGSGTATVSYAEALDVALCFGWIDGQKAKRDDELWLQRFTPRRPKSRWSQRNRARALDLIEAANRYAILYRIHDAKKPETRARRIEQFVAMLHDGETLHP